MVVTRTFVLDRPPPLAGLDYLAPPLDSDLAQVSSLFAFGIDVIVLTAVITWASLTYCPPCHPLALLRGGNIRWWCIMSQLFELWIFVSPVRVNVLYVDVSGHTARKSI